MSIENDIPPMTYVVSGSGEPLILAPGSLTGWLSWIPHAEKLAETRRVVRLQLHSVALGLAGDPLPSNYSIDFEVRALGKTLDDLAIRQVDFAGWSLGAELVLSYAIHHPHRVRSLTMIEPGSFWVLRSKGLLSEAVRREQQFAQTLATEDINEEQLIKFTHFTGLIPEEVDPRTTSRWPIWFQHRRSLRIGDAIFRHDSNIELVRAFDKPVLLVKGEGSAPHMHDIVDALMEELPNARVVTLPGGHAPHLISMQPFMEQFIRFLSAQSPT